MLINRIFFLVFVILLGTSAASAQGSDLPPNIVKDFKFHAPANKLKGRIAFSAKIGKYNRIFFLDLQSGKVAALVTGNFNSAYPAWDPKGNSIVFASDQSGKDELYKVFWNGKGLAKLPFVSKFGIDHPSWGPWYKHLVYYEINHPEKKYSDIIMQHPFDKSKRQRLTKLPGKNVTPRLSNNRSLLAYTTDRNWPGWDICIKDLKSGQTQCPLGGKDSYCRPAWHKDNKLLLFSYGSHKNINLGLYNLSDASIRPMTSLPNREYDAAWSPDYKDITFVAEDEKPGLFQLYVMSLKDIKPHLLLSAPYAIRYPAWTSRSALELEAARIREADKKNQQQKKLAAPENDNSTAQ